MSHPVESFVECDQKGCDELVEYGHLCAEHVKGVKVADSTISGAGKGLFATKHFEKGHVICEYAPRGVYHIGPSSEIPNDNMYVLTMDSNTHVDGSDPHAGFGRYANTIYEGNDKYHLNAAFQLLKGKLWLFATRNIEPGQEIFCDYGDDYNEQAVHKPVIRELALNPFASLEESHDERIKRRSNRRRTDPSAFKEDEDDRIHNRKPMDLTRKIGFIPDSDLPDRKKKKKKEGKGLLGRLYHKLRHS